MAKYSCFRIKCSKNATNLKLKFSWPDTGRYILYLQFKKCSNFHPKIVANNYRQKVNRQLYSISIAYLLIVPNTVIPIYVLLYKRKHCKGAYIWITNLHDYTYFTSIRPEDVIITSRTDLQKFPYTDTNIRNMFRCSHRSGD